MKKGFTTGACAAASACAALTSYLNKKTTSTIEIELPNGNISTFNVENVETRSNSAQASVVKDAGDDPDVTHGAKITTKLELIPAKKNTITFFAGSGVGIVTKPGLPLKVGMPAINPVPRINISHNLLALLKLTNKKYSVKVTISVANGAKLAKQTWNEKLGIIGGLSILGTTGIVQPFSCSAWLASITQAYDVAFACAKQNSKPKKITLGIATGSTSKKFLINKFKMIDEQIITTGPFFIALLKHINKNPKVELYIAAAPAKLTKIALGKSILHSKKSPIELSQVAILFNKSNIAEAEKEKKDTISVFELENMFPNFYQTISKKAFQNIAKVVNNGSKISLFAVDREAKLITQTLDNHDI